MSGDKFRHLEHADLALAIEDGLERIVRVDLRSLFLVLASILFDVVPEFFGQLRTWQRLGTDDRRKFFVWLYRLHEGGVWLAFRRSLFGSRFRHRG